VGFRRSWPFGKAAMTTLAASTKTHADALERVLRLLCGYRIFAARDGMFAHTAASQLLRSDHPQSLRSCVRMIGFPVYWSMWAHFDVIVRTARAADVEVLPEGSWKYLADHPEEGRIFDDAMAGKFSARATPVACLGNCGSRRRHPEARHSVRERRGSACTVLVRASQYSSLNRSSTPCQNCVRYPRKPRSNTVIYEDTPMHIVVAGSC
jgi:hypothetical protein